MQFAPMTDRKKPGWAFWTTVATVAIPLLYVLSFGPACWWFSEDDPDLPPGAIVDAPEIYWPIGRAYLEASRFRWGGRIRRAIRRYATLRHDWVTVPIGPGSSARVSMF